MASLLYISVLYCTCHILLGVVILRFSNIHNSHHYMLLLRSNHQSHNILRYSNKHRCRDSCVGE
ncbi:hypothetical protein BD408DRAFT_419057 [Parasitella parasitica]|nr:hypothetical protein BD408DRAFT_419057 [Parasitella parasitica]